jgi:hypothetical protein
VDDYGYFGITVPIDNQISPSRYVKNFIRNYLALETLNDNNIEIISIVEPAFKRQDLSQTMLFLAKIGPAYFQAPSNWPTFISHLKLLPQSTERVAYNKAFQFFAGAHLDEVDVLEIDAIVRDRLKEIVSIESKKE